MTNDAKTYGGYMEQVRTAVIGVGIQGERHAQKFKALETAALVGVVDANADRARAVAGELDTEAVADYRDLIGAVDAVAIATPTTSHFEIAGACLEQGVHVLLEKPLAKTMEEAVQLVDLAERGSCILQIGHQERFNPAVLAVSEHIKNPLFIESNRIAPYRPRSLDVSVVLDLMLHDIDLIHSFVRAPMVDVSALGRSVFSGNIDVANARIRFANGCVANVTSSRISMKTERSLRVFQEDSYASVDLHNKAGSIYTKRTSGPMTGPEDVEIQKHSFDENDAMLEQAQAFVASIAGGPPPLVSGRTGLEALKTAHEISALIAPEINA